MADLPLASWGRVRMFAAQINTEAGRTKVVHDLSSGDEHPVQDRGLRAVRTRVRILFDDFPDAPAPVDAVLILQDAVNSGKSAVFTHPLLGSYLAGVGDFTHEIDESGVITAEAEFIAEDSPLSVTPSSALSPGVDASTSVSQAADDLDAQLAAVGIETAITQDAREAADAWDANPDTPARTIANDTARISTGIAELIEAQGLENDILLWPSFRAAIMFGEAVRSAAVSAASSTEAVFLMRVTTPTALLPLAARVYGGDGAVERARQIAELNDISTPGWLPPGDYVMPARPPGSIVL